MKFICTYPGCNIELSNKYCLQRHETRHKEQKDWECEYCGKMFTLPQYLKDHINVHTGDKPYECKFAGCNAKFRQASKLSMHKRIHSAKIFIISKVNRGQEKSNRLAALNKIQFQ